MQKVQWNFIGLSTEEKPSEGEYVTNGSTFLEVDTSIKYIYYNGNWYQQKNSEGNFINVVDINGMSGTFSNEDFAKILSDNCVLRAGTQYFSKEYHAATVIRYGATPRLSNNKIIFDYIDIDKNSKSYELKNEMYSI